MSEKNYTGSEGIEKIQELIKDAHIGMLTTVSAEGALHSRPMALPDSPFDGSLWFISRNDSGKTDEIRHDSQVMVTFSEPKDGKYIALSGQAAVIRDRGLIHEHWTPMAKAWFPDGEDDPAVTLIQIRVDDCEYWEANSSRLVRLTKLALASITGAGKTDVGDTGHITV